MSSVVLGLPRPDGLEDTTIVHVLRHGEVFNPKKILYGRLPGYHLSGLGRTMADRAAKALAGRDVVHLVSSPMERAQETSEPLAAEFGLTPVIDARLIESENVFEGRAVGVGDGVLRNPTYWRHLYNPFRPSWGEPYVQVAARMRAALEAARDAARGHEAVCVSHQLPIWTLRLNLEQRRFFHDPRHRQCSLASITSVIFRGDELAGIAYTEPSCDLLPGASKVAGA